jgi:hypothetical protein
MSGDAVTDKARRYFAVLMAEAFFIIEAWWQGFDRKRQTNNSDR